MNERESNFSVINIRARARKSVRALCLIRSREPLFEKPICKYAIAFCNNAHNVGNKKEDGDSARYASQNPSRLEFVTSNQRCGIDFVAFYRLTFNLLIDLADTA